MNPKSSGSPKPIAFLGLAFAIIAFLFSMIPCIGFYAIGPGIIALVFSGISFVGSKQREENTSVSLAGLIIGIVAIAIGIYQYYEYADLFFKSKAQFERVLKKAGEEARDSIEDQALDKVEEKLEQEIKKDSLQEIKNDSIAK